MNKFCGFKITKLGIFLFVLLLVVFTRLIQPVCAESLVCKENSEYAVFSEFLKKMSHYELNELQQHNPEKLTSSIFKRMNYVKSGNLDADAELMFEKVKPFLEEVRGKSRDDYVNYVKQYMHTNIGKMTAVDASEFAKIENDSDYLVTYHGCADKSACEVLRRGTAIIDGADDNSDVFPLGCHSLMTCPYLTRGCVFMENGEVVKFATNNKAKLINQDYLETVFKRMIEIHSDYFNDYLSLLKLCGDYNLTLHPNFVYLNDFIKEKTGFDYFANVDSKSAQERLLELSQKYYDLSGAPINTGQSVIDGPLADVVSRSNFLHDNEISEEQRQVRKELDNLVLQHPMPCNFFDKCSVETWAYKLGNIDRLVFDPVLWLRYDQGLLTKLFGFDVHVRVDDRWNSDKAVEQAERSGSFVQFPEAVFDIVNFDNVFVCADEFKPELKLGLNSPYDAEKLLPSVVTAAEVNKKKINLYSGDLNQDAELMFEKVRLFLEEAEKAGVTEKQIDDYSRNYIKQNSNSQCGSISVVNSEWFDEHKDDSDWLILYRGISNKPFAASARRGEVYVGGPVRGNYYPSNLAQTGNGIYLTSVWQHAKYWAQIPDVVKGDKNQKYGEVVKFALPINSKIVTSAYIRKVFDKMLETHPNFPYFKKFKDLEKINGYCCNAWSASYGILFDWVKQKTGFDFFADVDKKSPQERAELFEAVFKELLEDKEKAKELSEFIKKNYGDNFALSDYLIDKIFFLSRNIGLLAKLMGFDVVYDYYPGCVVDSEKPFDVYGNPEIDEFNVVDFSNLVVCSEPLDIKARIRWGEEIVL